MPELPEVETVVRRLQQVLPGKTINSLTVLKEKSFVGDQFLVMEKTITEVSRRAKLIRIHLSDSTSLLVHLKMTGQLIYVDDQERLGGGHPTLDWVQELPSNHTRVWFDLGSHAALYFNDQRIFGWVKHMDEEAVQREYAK